LLDLGPGQRIIRTGLTKLTIVNLDQIARNVKPQFGELKMTIAQFFRVNGGTTQLRGVTPDIAFPGFSDAADFGESSFDNALPWTTIKPANYAPVGDLKLQVPLLLASHANRVRQDKDFQNLLGDIARAQQLRKSNGISLNEADRRKEREAQEKRLTDKDAGTAALGVARAPQDDGLQMGERNLTQEIAAEKARKAGKDILLNEAVAILGDDVALKRNSFKMSNGPGAANRLIVMEMPTANRSTQPVTQ